MRLKAAVLEVVRGAAGATLLVAVGCSGSESIAREPAAPVAPVSPAVASPPAVAPAAAPVTVPVAPGAAPAGKPSEPPSVVLAPASSPSLAVRPPTNVADVLLQADPAAPTVDAPTTPTERPRRARRRRDDVSATFSLPHGLPPDVAVACGRG